MGEDEKPKPANHRRASSQYIVLNRMQEKENLLLLLKLIKTDGKTTNKKLKKDDPCRSISGSQHKYIHVYFTSSLVELHHQRVKKQKLLLDLGHVCNVCNV